MMVISFAATVAVTRYYLEATGYPQIGGGDLHIAHLLWGGLAMFIAVLLPLIFAGSWAYGWAAVLGGVGVGLFIDEVGKFITKTNDYFYPAAAPIIYGVFLLTVLLYLEIRHWRDDSPTARIHAVLDQLPVVIDQDITRRELERLTNDLQRISAQRSNPVLADLADNLLAFLRTEHLHIVPEQPAWYQRLWAGIRDWWNRHVTRSRHRLLLVLGLILPELIALVELLLLVVLLLLPTETIQQWAQQVFTSAELGSLNDPRWVAIRLVLDSVTGVLAIAAGILLLAGKERRGVSLGVIALVLSLTIDKLLVFYQDQFQALTFTLVQGVVLLLAIVYRRRYLDGIGSVQPL